MEQVKPLWRRNQWLSLAAVIGTTYWLLTVALLHLLRTDYDPLEHTISNYATGSYGYLMSAAFMVWGISILALGASVLLGFRPRPRAGGVLLIVAGIAIFFAGVFKGDVITQASPTTTTTSGGIHDLASMVFFLSLIVTMFVMARSFKKNPRWVQLRWLSVILAAATTITLVAFIATSGTAVAGLVQRVFAIWVVSWRGSYWCR